MSDPSGQRRMSELIRLARAELVPTDQGDVFFMSWPVPMASLWSEAKKAGFIEYLSGVMSEAGIRWIVNNGIDSEDVPEHE